MSVECRRIARAASTVLKKISSSLRLVLDEPASWTIVLDNSEGDYDPDESIANPRTYSNTLSIEYETADGADSWTSPDLVLEDYDYDTDVVTLTGRCRLAQLDRDDQVIDNGSGSATFENTTVDAVLDAIAAEYSMTVTGAPTRAVRSFQAVGNPLDMFRDLLYPTHCFRMGSGSQIVVQAIDSNGSGPAYADAPDLEVVRFKRTSEIYNKATVERVTPNAGLQQLAFEERSGGDTLVGVQSVTLSAPSRYLLLRSYPAQIRGDRGVITSMQLKDSEGGIVGASPYNKPSYVGNTPVASVDFQYELTDPEAVNWGPWTPRWIAEFWGYDTEDSPPEVEGYSATATAGSGDRPYPEPFTSLAIETESDAQDAADALVALGTRQGNILNFQCALHPDLIPWPNNALDLTDFKSGLTGTDWICEAVSIDEAEGGDTGTISIEATRSEVS